MGPREEDNDMLLLVVVSLICVTLVGAMEVAPSQQAIAAKSTVLANEEPVRVVLPFAPNTTPGQR